MYFFYVLQVLSNTALLLIFRFGQFAFVLLGDHFFSGAFDDVDRCEVFTLFLSVLEIPNCGFDLGVVVEKLA